MHRCGYEGECCYHVVALLVAGAARRQAPAYTGWQAVADSDLSANVFKTAAGLQLAPSLWSQGLLLCRYDDLANYRNERSLFLAQIREEIEEAWYTWEVQQHVDEAALRQMTPEQVAIRTLQVDMFMNAAHAMWTAKAYLSLLVVLCSGNNVAC